MRRIAAAAAALAACIAVPASAMDVATFLAKADALKAKGPMALFSSDIGVLKGEAKKATDAYLANKAARAAAGKPPIVCAPPGARKMGSDEFLTSLRAIPPAQRSISLTEGMTRVLQRKYPCR